VNAFEAVRAARLLARRGISTLLARR
jgi:hypothetical protein